MSKPFHKPSVKKPPHVKKFSTQRYSSLCRDSKCPTIWMLVHCGAGTSLGPQLGTSRLCGRPAFGLTPSEPRGPSLRPLGSSCPSVNSIHSWVFTITALGAVVLSKELHLVSGHAETDLISTAAAKFLMYSSLWSSTWPNSLCMGSGISAETFFTKHDHFLVTNKTELDF